MSKNLALSCIMTIFGGTGDLAHRKLIPALYNLFNKELLPDEFAVVGIGRKPLNDVEYRNSLLPSVEKFSPYKLDLKKWEIFSNRIFYYRMDLKNYDSYSALDTFLKSIDTVVGIKGNRLFYLSVAPPYFETITLNLKKNNMVENIDSWQRVIIEKPFGQNLETARYLNRIICDVFPPENIYRIDHYLGKEMLQNLMVIRFGNAMFESMWNSRYIDNIQITSSETLGVENRAEYYDSAGALKDMLQNHMLQLLAMVAMEPPINLDPKSIKDEKVKLLRSLTKMTSELIKSDVVRGQYGEGLMRNIIVPSYRNEAGISHLSNTETFIALRLFAGNFRWGGMPFYLRTGKRLPVKTTNIIIEFKSMPEILYFKEFKGMQPNLMKIGIQPHEGISLSFNAKKPGISNEITNVKMDFCQNCTSENNSPESYERLLADALRSDQTLFTSWEEIEESWRLVDNISEAWKNDKPDFPNYTPGSWGPSAANELLSKSGHHWWDI
jgi:glucose-6-phosphate 1-dehydrogenase